jgi:hypothetical protein
LLLDLDKHSPPVWPERFKPAGEDEGAKEDFEVWWARHSGELGNLHPKICEQWIYRHWLHSPFSFLQLGALSWEHCAMHTEALLGAVHREWASTLHPGFDFDAFQEHADGWKHPTSVALDQGTWDFPIVVLETPCGIVSSKGRMPDVRLVLVEGHQRHRYLNALNQRGVRNGPHEVFKMRINDWTTLADRLVP